MLNEWNLKQLKETYSSLGEKYNLPSFEKLNGDFQIEKVAEYETDFVLREIRENITAKFLNYLRFIESLINPSNGPMFMFAVIKTLGAREKEKLSELYKKIAKIDVDLIELDLEYSEKKEAEAIKKYYEMWQEIKKELIEIVSVIKNNWDVKEENGKGNYLG
ncbi:MAG: hypothetical protein PHQ66_01695 [Candidatus Nanoarchaeia archaeon]|nr:hypothetical protein [Candidatus Nanoarchaeia archaeon]MDD5357913.1 hypothetical protein [Candidatus Nanoarchaeia archaeon]MDD5588832.1 hypothetical protein [Candidatus Nanoarchaeia archaeon]